MENEFQSEKIEIEKINLRVKEVSLIRKTYLTKFKI